MRAPYGRALAREFRRVGLKQLVFPVPQGGDGFPVALRQPEKKVDAPVMVAGKLVVVTEALGAVADESGRQARIELRKTGFQPRFGNRAEVFAAERQSLH